MDETPRGVMSLNDPDRVSVECHACEVTPKDGESQLCTSCCTGEALSICVHFIFSTCTCWLRTQFLPYSRVHDEGTHRQGQRSRRLCGDIDGRFKDHESAVHCVVYHLLHIGGRNRDVTLKIMCSLDLDVRFDPILQIPQVLDATQNKLAAHQMKDCGLLLGSMQM